MSQSNSVQATSSKRRSWLVAVVLVAIVIAVLPWLLAKTTLRDRMLNAIVNSDDITVSSTNASFGYITPLSLSGLQVRSKDDATKIEVARIQADSSWLGLLLSRPELGTFRFDNPTVDVLVDPKKLKSNDAAKDEATNSKAVVDLPNLTAQINDASIVVRTAMSAEPPIDLEHIQLNVRLEQQADGSVLRVDPTTVFDHQRITPQLCGQGLQLIAPLLADEVDAEGSFSLRLEHFEIPIGTAKGEATPAIHIEGELQLHQASVGLRNTIAKGVSDLVLKLVGIGAPDRLTVAKDLVVDFQVIDGRVRHEGLALLLPHGESSVVFTSSGSVGLDETLDLSVSVKLPDQLLGGNTLVQRFTKEPIVLAITGTMDQPKVELANSSGLVKSIQGLIKGAAVDDETGATADPVTNPELEETISEAADVVGGLLKGLRDRAEQRTGSEEDRPLIPNLRDRLRNRLQPAPDPPAPPEPVDL